MLGLAIGVHLLNLLTLPFVALIIYFKRFKFSFTSFLIPIIITLITFLTIYIGIIKGIPDLMSKLGGNMGIVAIIPILLILSILFFILAEKNTKFNIPSYIISGISFALLIILITNTVLIQSSTKLSTQIHIDLITIQESIDEDDKEIYQLTNQIENSNLKSQQKINDLINTRNNLSLIHI